MGRNEEHKADQKILASMKIYKPLILSSVEKVTLCPTTTHATCTITIYNSSDINYH